MPRRPAIDGPRKNDDKGWWRELVDHVFDQVAPSSSELDRDNFFEVAYEHFAEAGVWELYPEVPEVSSIAATLSARRHFKFRRPFAIDSRTSRDLEIFRHVFISSELGADKPDPEIFRRALKLIASECERGPTRRRRSGTRLESSRSGWLVGLSIGSTKKFAARFADDFEAVGQRAACLTLGSAERLPYNLAISSDVLLENFPAGR